MRWSLRTKIILYASCFVLLFLTLWLSWSFHSGRRIAYEAIEVRAIGLADEIGYAFEALAKHEGNFSLQRIVEQTGTIRDVSEVGVTDREGRYFAHNEQRRIGSEVDPRVLQHVLESERRQITFGAHDFVVFQPLHGEHYLPEHRSDVVGVITITMDMEPTNSRLRGEFLSASATTAIFILILSTSLVVVLNRTVLGPIERLQEGTKKLAGGDWKAMVMPRSADELGDLAHSFNSMSRELERRTKELEAIQQELQESEALLGQSAELVNLGYAVWHEVDERYIAVSEGYARLFGYTKEKFLATFTSLEKDLELIHPEDRDRYRAYLDNEEDFDSPAPDIEYRIVTLDGRIRHVLQRYKYVFDTAGQPTQSLVSIQDITERKLAQEELQRSNEELQAFGYSVSHDLRAPLRAMSGFSDLIREDYGSLLDETGHHYLERISRSAVQMDRLIDGLLRLGRLSQRKMQVGAVMLDALATEIVSDLQRSDPDRGAEVRVQPGLQVHGDPELLKIALTNLLDNAWKFSRHHEHAVIEFGVLDSDGRRTFFVRDNGVGFDMNYAESIFGMFQRLHSTEEFDGVGVGLRTVQRIVDRHGGRLWVEAAPGQGATFYFTLDS